MQSKKQLFQLISDIAHLNDTAWGNHAGSYDANKSAALLIEEALEAIGALVPRDNARAIVALHSTIVDEPIPEVAAFDSLLDGLFITIGELHKLGLTPHQMVDGLQIVYNANLQKLGAKDSEGKVIKPIGFVPPEEQLQTILDSRTTK